MFQEHIFLWQRPQPGKREDLIMDSPTKSKARRSRKAKIIAAVSIIVVLAGPATMGLQHVRAQFRRAYQRCPAFYLIIQLIELRLSRAGKAARRQLLCRAHHQAPRKHPGIAVLHQPAAVPQQRHGRFRSQVGQRAG